MTRSYVGIIACCLLAGVSAGAIPSPPGPSWEDSLRGLSQNLPEPERTRLRAQLEFALGLAERTPGNNTALLDVPQRALNAALRAAEANEPPGKVVEAAERVMAPLASQAKQYVVHCVGHAHIDMNWMWSWPETTSVAHDTFVTVNQLMTEYPAFRFAQSQAAVYDTMDRLYPELAQIIRQRIKEGRWETPAAHWVEGDKNLVSGESLCRHLSLSARRMHAQFGVPIGSMQIDWEPDTFGHALTLPTILNAAGVRWYYHCRAGRGEWLYRWQAPDGSSVLTWDDSRLWYNGPMDARIGWQAIEVDRRYGLKHSLHVFGVGDHGGGPTRQLIERAIEMDAWPVFPRVRFSTAQAFFTAAEQAKRIPVVTDELNPVFQGCYTSQAWIKEGNRVSEAALVRTEQTAVLAGALCGMPWPGATLQKAWQNTLFNHFHDILPGSGVPATVQYTLGLYQEVAADGGAVRTRALRALANLAAGPGIIAPQGGQSAGAGNLTSMGALSTASTGGDRFVVFNPVPWPMDRVVTLRLWNDPNGGRPLAVQMPDGRTVRAQDAGHGGFWGHNWRDIRVPLSALPALGWRVVRVVSADENAVLSPQTVQVSGLEASNGLIKVRMDGDTAGVASLVDLKTERELVSDGRPLGLLEMGLEPPHGMTAWELAGWKERREVSKGVQLHTIESGPYRARWRAHVPLSAQSHATVEYILDAGASVLQMQVQVEWRERGDGVRGVPALRVSFPADGVNGVLAEAPLGSVRRPADGREMPMRRWLHLDRKDASLWIGNDRCHGYTADPSGVTVSMLRASYDPDPWPDNGSHRFRFWIAPSAGWKPAQAIRYADALEHEPDIVNVASKPGQLPADRWLVHLESPNVTLSTLSRSSDGASLLIRVYDADGTGSPARIRFAPGMLPPAAQCRMVDLLERPAAGQVSQQGGLVTLQMKPYALRTARVNAVPPKPARPAATRSPKRTGRR